MDPIDAFDRLERRGRGLIVPLVLFCAGLAMTLVACLAIKNLDQRIEQRFENQSEPVGIDAMVQRTRLMNDDIA